MKTKKKNGTCKDKEDFLSVQASFVSYIQHANSCNLYNKVGKVDENNSFDFDRA